nr:uncharacterized protein LOC109120063 [Solanum lycopersicum]
MIVILVYVDDLLITGNSSRMVQEAKDTLHKNFKMKDLGSLRYFLGIEILKSKEGLLLNQRKYALQLISEAGLSGAKTVSTLLEFNQKLTSVEFDQHTGGSDDAELEDVTAYQRLIGKLLYLTITRPDICFSVQVLSQFMQHPKVSHWEAALRVVRYIKRSPGLGVMLRRGTGVTKLTGYFDSDWSSCPNTRRSTTGYMVKLGDSLISWKSKKQQTVSRSSAEAEYRSLAALVAELIWLAGLLNELHFSGATPISVFTDSKSAIQIAENPVFHERTKHIDIDCHFIREKVKSGFIDIQHLSTTMQPADILTKGLGANQHHLLMTKLGVLDVFHPSV